MSEFLVFRMAAAMGAMGELAGHHHRSTLRHPLRSSISGLIGAALGVPRSDRDGQQALATHYLYGSVVSRRGSLLRDFHTFESIPNSAIRNPDSRPQALEVARRLRKSKTNLSVREYIEDMDCLVVVKVCVEVPEWSLGQMRKALLSPKYLLYFGRKACPLSRPLNPGLVEAESPERAVRKYFRDDPDTGQQLGGVQEALFDSKMQQGAEQNAGATLHRRQDLQLNRSQWLFGESASVLFPLQLEASEDG